MFHHYFENKSFNPLLITLCSNTISIIETHVSGINLHFLCNYLVFNLHSIYQNSDICIFKNRAINVLRKNIKLSHLYNINIFDYITNAQFRNII